MFDLDEAPDGELGDEFGVSDEDDEMLADGEDDEIDSAFASSDDGEGGDDEDEVMVENNDDEDEEGGQITTNLEDDLDDEGFTLPAVDGEGDEIEHGTSLKDVDARMRWLVGVCCGGDDKVSKGVPGK